MILAIGLVGQIRAGKGTVDAILQRELKKFGYSVVSQRFSDALVDTAKLWFMPLGRETYQKISKGIQGQFPGALAHVVEQRALSVKEDCVILDGLRWIDHDLQVVRCLPNNRLIYVDAPAEVRWRRSVQNSEKPDEQNATFEQFLERDNATTELEIPQFKQFAELVIDNSVDDMQILENQVVQFVKTLL